jgi:hypothetical protein
VDPSEIANMALAEALFLRGYATARAAATPRHGSGYAEAW